MKGAKGKGRKTGKPVEKGKPIGGPAGKGEAAIPTRIPMAAKPPTALSKRYLLNITVGEDYAVCYDCPSSKCDVDKRYKFNHPVYVQCYTDTGSTVSNETYWYLTTDFCYVREGDFWESLFDRMFPSSKDGWETMLTIEQNIDSPPVRTLRMRIARRRGKQRRRHCPINQSRSGCRRRD